MKKPVSTIANNYFVGKPPSFVVHGDNGLTVQMDGYVIAPATLFRFTKRGNLVGMRKGWRKEAKRQVQLELFK